MDSCLVCGKELDPSNVTAPARLDGKTVYVHAGCHWAALRLARTERMMTGDELLEGVDVFDVIDPTQSNNKSS